jgi:hypothetical protein
MMVFLLFLYFDICGKLLPKIIKEVAHQVDEKRNRNFVAKRLFVSLSQRKWRRHLEPYQLRELKGGDK